MHAAGEKQRSGPLYEEIQSRKAKRRELVVVAAWAGADLRAIAEAAHLHRARVLQLARR